jgi:hypothetical protein
MLQDWESGASLVQAQQHSFSINPEVVILINCCVYLRPERYVPLRPDVLPT